MSSLLVVISIILFINIITILKLYDCGVPFYIAVFMSLTMYKLIKINFKIFLKCKDQNLKQSIKILVLPLRYKNYLEFIANNYINFKSTIESVREVAPKLNRNERIKLNKLLKSKGINSKIDKNNKLVYEKAKINSKVNKKESINIFSKNFMNANNINDFQQVMSKAFG